MDYDTKRMYNQGLSNWYEFIMQYQMFLEKVINDIFVFADIMVWKHQNSANLFKKNFSRAIKK
ncbi:hypothetical protein HYD93_02895 [Mycoplasmopsis bovis]|nr:hypothetical protein HYD93_02895 [Mycoplasmopsis bovis]